jgi:hypothetical protein
MAGPAVEVPFLSHDREPRMRQSVLYLIAMMGAGMIAAAAWAEEPPTASAIPPSADYLWAKPL